MEIGVSSSTDYTSKLETDMRKETGVTSSKGKSSGMNIGISYGPINFGFGSKKKRSRAVTSSEFQRTLKSTERKASKSFDMSQRVEVSTSKSTSITNERSSLTNIQVENINRLKTMNLAMYEVRNVYQIDLNLHQLSITIVASNELVAGTGLREEYTLPLRDIRDIEDIEHLKPENIYGNTTNIAEYYIGVLKMILSQIKKDYGEALKEETVDAVNEIFEPGDNPTKDSLITKLEKIAELFDERDHLIDRWSSSIASPALHMEASLGVIDALDIYARDMRKAEIKYRNAQAAALSPLNSDKETHNTISGMSTTSLRKLVLMTSSHISEGVWQLRLGEQVKGEVVVRTSTLTLTFEWDTDQEWIKELQRDGTLNIHNTENGKVIWYK